MGTFEFIVFILVLASCTWLGLTAIWQSKEISKLKERVSNEKKPMYNIWLSSLSNNLPMILDNQHGKETKGKKCHWDFEDIAKKMSFKLSDLIPTEKDVALAFQKQQFEEKEKKYVEKIRQLEKILADEEIKLSVDGQVTNMKADKLKHEKFYINLEKSYLQNEVERLKRIIENTEKRSTEAYALIANVYEFEQTIMPEYGRYNAGAIDISEFGKELESTFREYFRREKKIKESEKQAKVVMTVTEDDENILDIVDKILTEEKTTGRGYNTVTTLTNKKSK